jgi:GNAT superfamily N-acetyltransferase
MLLADGAKVVVRPLTPARWADLESLFGDRGACGGCWCMYWRLARAEFDRQKGAGNRRALRRRVESGRAPGLLAYVEGKPAGWCAVAPREEYPRLGSSRILKPVDEQAVWSVTCFFIAKEHRGRGVSGALLEAAVEFARKHGGRIVEGYPVDKGEVPDVFAWTGLASAFRKAGFVEAARTSETRPIMRLAIKKAPR